MSEYDADCLKRLKERKRSAPADLEAREAAENRAAYARLNGGRRPRTGRIEQKNFRMTAELKAAIEAECRRRDIGDVVLLEEMFEAYQARRGAQ